MVASLVPIELDRICHHLLVGNILEDQEIRLVLVVVVAGLRAVSLAIEEALGTSVSAAHRRVYCPIRDGG